MLTSYPLDVMRTLLMPLQEIASISASVFHVAVASGNFDIAKEVLDHLLCGGVSKQSIEHFMSPLTVAILFNNEHIFKYLRHKSFKVDTSSLELGLTPMMFAGSNPNKFCNNLLISFVSSTEAKNITHEDLADDIALPTTSRSAKFDNKDHQISKAPFFSCHQTYRL